MGKKTKAAIETPEEKIARRLPLAEELLEQNSHKEIVDLVKKFGIKGALLEAIIKKSKDEKYDMDFIRKLRNASEGKEIEVTKERKALFRKLKGGRELTHKEIIDLAEGLEKLSETLSIKEKEEIKELWKSKEGVKKVKKL